MDEFGSPAAFLLLVPVLLLPVQGWVTGRNVLAVPGLAHVRVGWSVRAMFWWLPQVLQIVGLVLLVIALARPWLVRRTVSVESEGLDIVLAVDTSGSMRNDDLTARGMPATRLQVAKGVIGDFIDGRPHDRIGLVVFGEEAFTQVPLTLDHVSLQQTLRDVEIGMAGSRGTAIGSGLAVAAKRLKELEAPDRVVILLTDGQNNAGTIAPMQAAEAAAALGITVYTIGVGERAGGGLLGLRDGIDERGLTAVAEVTGGRYFRATDTRSLQRIYETIDELEPSTAEVRELVDTQDRFRRWLLPGLLILALQVLLAHTVFRRGP